MQTYAHELCPRFGVLGLGIFLLLLAITLRYTAWRCAALGLGLWGWQTRPAADSLPSCAIVDLA